MIVTGNPNQGLAHSIHKLYPDAQFVSRSTDLSSPPEQACSTLRLLIEIWAGSGILPDLSF